MEPMDYLPLWAFFAVVLVIALACIEIGYRIGAWRSKKFQKEPSAPLGTIVGSVLGLLAFMLGFTFNVAVSRFDERRIAVLNEANAIGTTYLRADFFDEPHRVQIKKLLREYVQVRSNGFVVGPQLAILMTKSQVLQDQLWSRAATLGREHQNPITALFVNSLNDTIDMHAKRTSIDIYARVPVSIWAVLFAVSVISMVGVGYFSGLSGTRTWAESLLLVSTFALVMLLVADLDRPHEGFIEASQQPMQDLEKQIGSP